MDERAFSGVIPLAYCGDGSRGTGEGKQRDKLPAGTEGLEEPGPKGWSSQDAAVGSDRRENPLEHKVCSGEM